MVQLQPHEHELLPAASCAEASGIAAELPKADRLIQPHGRRIVRDDLQLQLQVAHFFCAFDAGEHQGLSDASSPVFAFDGYAELGAVPDFFLSSLFVVEIPNCFG